MKIEIDANELTALLEYIKGQREPVCNADDLAKSIMENLPHKMKKCEYLIPYDRSDMSSFLHRNGRVLGHEGFNKRIRQYKYEIFKGKSDDRDKNFNRKTTYIITRIS